MEIFLIETGVLFLLTFSFLKLLRLSIFRFVSWIFLSLVVQSSILGCTTIGGVNKAFEAVNFSDGINQAEAQVIAQEKLVAYKDRRNYVVKSPEVIDNAIVRQYPEYWFVSFEANKFDLSFWNYLVVINKETGAVLFADSYEPLRTVDYDWVFKK